MSNLAARLVVAILVCSALLIAQRDPPRPVPVAAPGAKVLTQDPDRSDKPKDEVAEIDKLITDALAAWRAKDESKAAELLQTAAGKIQARAARNLATFLPTKAAGWTFGEPQVDSGAWGGGDGAMQWSNARVTASHAGDEVSANVQITNSPQIFQAMQGMVAMQAQMKAILKQQGRDIDVQTRNGFQIMTMVDEDTSNGWLIGKRIVIVIDVEHGNRKLLDQVVGWLDLAGLGKLDGQ